MLVEYLDNIISNFNFCLLALGQPLLLLNQTRLTMTDTLNIERPLLLWSPRDSAATNMSKFRNQVARKYPHVPMSNYADLHSWSVHPSTALDFWKELFEFEGLQPEGLVGRVLGDEGAFVSCKCLHHLDRIS